MIHSLAGGEIKDIRSHTFCLVQIIGGATSGAKLWYISNIFDLKCGDTVLVPLGALNKRESAIVQKIVTTTKNGITPIPLNKAKEIIKKL